MTMSNDVPVGMTCPGCGQPPRLIFSDVQVACGSGNCNILFWDPTLTVNESADQLHAIDLPSELG